MCYKIPDYLAISTAVNMNTVAIQCKQKPKMCNTKDCMPTEIKCQGSTRLGVSSAQHELWKGEDLRGSCKIIYILSMKHYLVGPDYREQWNILERTKKHEAKVDAGLFEGKTQNKTKHS
jgi:hypothetical protein